MSDSGRDQHRSSRGGGSSRPSGKQASSRATSGRGRSGAGASRPSGRGRTQASAQARTQASAQARRIGSGDRRRVYKPALRIPLRSQTRRIQVALALVLLVMLVFAGRAFQVQALESRSYASAAAEAMTTSRTLIPQRGAITDRNGVTLASSQAAVRIIADPLMISRNGVDTRVEMGPKQTAKAKQAPSAIAQALAKYLGGNSDDYLVKLTDLSRKHYAVIAEKVPAWTYQQLRQELQQGNWNGLYKEDDPVRVYPSRDVASNIVGFMGRNDKTGQATGAGGLEYSLNKELTGSYGKEVYDSSFNGRIPLGNSTLIPATNGTSYQLTLDSGMQQMALQALNQGITRAAAKNGSVVVMNIKTSEVLAMATSPGFDSNEPGKADAANLGNAAVSTPYEPGSVQKVLTMAALADAGMVTPDTKVEVPERLPSGDGKIKDSFSHDTLHLTARGVIANSSNIGTALLARQMDKQRLVNYLSSFGLGHRTNIGLPGESSGYLPKADMADYTRDQISFGQGLSVTALQEAAAVAGVVNGGVYHAPTLIRAKTDAQGNWQQVAASEPKRVISKKASDEVLDMMEAVVAKDPSKRAIANYRTAGKTGTAQRVDPSCGCYRGYTVSYVGVAPVEDPQILVYVMIDQPTQGTEGSTVALPVANEIMTLALPRYGVLPSTTKARKEALEYQP